MLPILEKKKRILLKTLQSTQCKLLLLVLGSIAFIGIAASWATFSHDDPTNMIIFRNIQSEHGLAKSLWLLFTNFDFRGFEYRPFWLSRTGHFFLFQLFGLHATPYIIITSTAHILSSLLIFSLISQLTKNKELGFFAALIWVFTPFSAPLFVFHHFCYQVVPIYLFLLYAFLRLKAAPLRIGWTFLLLFCMVFSGEQSLPLLFLFLFFHSLHAFKKRDYFKSVYNAVQGIWAVGLFVAHATLLSVLPTESHPNQRRFYFFTNHSFLETKTLLLQWLKEQVFPTYYQALSIFSSDYAQLHITHPQLVLGGWGIFLGISILLYIAFAKQKANTFKSATQIGALVGVLSAGSFFVYAYLFVMSGGGGYFPRYAFFTGTAALIAVMLWLFSIFQVHVARLVSWILVSYLVLLFMITNLELKPIIFTLSHQIDEQLAAGRAQDKKALIISNTLHYPPRAQQEWWWGIPVADSRGVVNGLINMYYTGVQNQYKYFYSLDRVARDFFGYEMTSYQNFVETSQGIEVTDISGNKKIYQPNEILVMGNPTITYSYRDAAQQSVISYPDWTTFQHSAAYKGVVIFSPSKRYTFSEEYLLTPPLATFDLGNSLTDVASTSTTQATTKPVFGYLAGQNITNSPSPVGQLLSSYWLSNRAGEFSYTIPGSTAGRWLVFDFLELWMAKSNGRLFSIQISDGTTTQTIGPIDLVSLGGFQQPLSIATWIGGSEKITITTTKDPHAADIPFISGIRLYDHLIP